MEEEINDPVAMLHEKSILNKFTLYNIKKAFEIKVKNLIQKKNLNKIMETKLILE